MCVPLQSRCAGFLQPLLGIAPQFDGFGKLSGQNKTAGLTANVRAGGVSEGKADC
jgi:hypothetical protein